jgi:hypothetical protein
MPSTRLNRKSCTKRLEHSGVKNRHILLLSDRRRAETDLPLCSGGRYRFTHCTSDAACTVGEVDQLQPSYDWILIDAAMLGGDKREFVQSLRAMGHLLSEGADSRFRHGSCSVEWDANGTLQLRCRGRGPISNEPRSCMDVTEPQPPGFIFEYHAPMKRTG